MEGCCANLVKYSLFLTNFLVFVLGCVTLGFGIWIVVDKPSFTDLFENASDVLNDYGADTSGVDIGLYSSAPYILIAVAVIVSLIAFFGCCGAIKENKCMLITYFVIMLAIFIAGIVGVVLTFQGTLEDQIKKPLKDSMDYYKPASDATQDVAYRNVWNEIQHELKCCGVDNASDWSVVEDFPSGFNKPEGCCQAIRSTDEPTEAQIEDCRKASPTGDDSASKYYFKGCYTVIVEEIENQQDKIYAASIAIVVVMFLNMLSAFAMCTMADKH